MIGKKDAPLPSGGRNETFLILRRDLDKPGQPIRMVGTENCPPGELKSALHGYARDAGVTNAELIAVAGSSIPV